MFCVWVVYVDTNVYNGMGMTEVNNVKVVYVDTAYVPEIQRLKNILNAVLGVVGVGR